MPGVLLRLESRGELLLRQMPALEEKGVQLEIINAVFIHRLLHPRRRHIEGNERRSRGQRSEEHTSELQSPCNLVCRLLLEKKKYLGDSFPDATFLFMT